MARERVNILPLPTWGSSLLAIAVMLSASILIMVFLLTDGQAETLATTSYQQSDPHEMVLIPAGQFIMGNEGAYDDETPRHSVNVSSFYIDEHEVTNAQFSAFVNATGYITKAEREGHCWAYFKGETDWQDADGTDWQHPQGQGSTIKDTPDHPVVCVTWDDAVTYAMWAGKRLATEAEWEYAARGGSNGHFVARTDGGVHSHNHHSGGAQVVALADRSPSSKSHSEGTHRNSSTIVNHDVAIEANVWEGHWPEYNQLDDGYY